MFALQCLKALQYKNTERVYKMTNWQRFVINCRFVKCCIITLIQYVYIIDGQCIDAFIQPELEYILLHNITFYMLTLTAIIHIQLY